MSSPSSFFIVADTARVPTSDRDALLSNPGFGRVFSDHMVTIQYSSERGWHDATIGPRRALYMDPSSLVFHYAQEIFEGLKAYRHPDSSAALFRPAANARRMGRSAERLSMAQLPEEMFLESVRELVRLDKDWIPPAAGAALYLRPFMIANQAALGVRPSDEYLYCVLASSVGSYFESKDKSLSLWVSSTCARAAAGGTGEAKCGGNYAASLPAIAEATREGCDQAVFLDANERRWIEELGGMNIFFVFKDGSIATPPLGGTILAGITRDSLMILARDMGLTVREERYAIDQWHADALSGKLQESFACGTAAVVAPIGRVRGPTFDFSIGYGDCGPVTKKLRDALVQIQHGLAEDRHGWIERVVE